MRHSAKGIIEASFKQLIQAKSIDKMTVTEVCDLAAINRQTFYNHYQGLIDIFKVIFKRDLFELIAQDRTLDTWDGGFLATMHYLKKHHVMILHVYDSSYRMEASQYFSDLSSQLMCQVLDECMKRRGLELEACDCDFIIQFYCYVFMGLMMDWMNQGMKESPEALLKKLKLMIDGSIMTCIEKFAEKERHHWIDA